MNHLFRYATSVSQHIYYEFNPIPLLNLTARQQKILLVVSSIAVSIFVAICIAYRCCFSGNSSLSDHPTLSFSTSGKDFQNRSLSGSSNQVTSPAIPFGTGIVDFKPLPKVEPKIPSPVPNLLYDELACIEAEISSLHLDLEEMLKDENLNGLMIEHVSSELNNILKIYPKKIREYIESYKKSADKVDVYERSVVLYGVMNRHKDNEEFIHSCLKEIDLCLSNTFFTSKDRLCLEEESKVDLIVFSTFFSIADKHVKTIEKKDPQLVVNLKVKFANLPIRDEKDPTIREKDYSNIYLSERDQLEILVKHLQAEEEKHLTALIQKIETSSVDHKEFKKFSKMAMKERSHLSPANIGVLQDALVKQMGKGAPTNWNDLSHVQKCITEYSYFNCKPDNNHSVRDEILILHCASKARQFFESQIGLEEGEIQIPRWYHATQHYPGGSNFLQGIIRDGQIEIRHQQEFEGAWVANQRLVRFGNSVLCFSHRITKLDLDVFIGGQHGEVLWRGIRKCPIPLVNQSTKVSNVILVGIEKGSRKVVKREIIQDLKRIGVTHPTVVSLDQVDYIQKEIAKTIGGNLNLTQQWWGKGDFTHLDKLVKKN